MADNDDKKSKKNENGNEESVEEAKQTESKEKSSSSSGPLSTKEAKELVENSYKEAMETVRSAMSEPVSLGPIGTVTASQSDITDELEKGGPAFGSFVKNIGLAVADAQKALDENLVATAKAISDTQIDVIAIFEQQIKDDDGSMDEGIVHMQKLPLINYLMPTAYQWSRVYLQADMKVSEFNSANGMNIKSKTSGFGGSLGASYGLLRGYGLTGSLGGGFSNNSFSQDSSYSQDVAAGTLHMEATLEPRADIELPRPFILQKGPQLKISVGIREDLDKENNVTTDPSAVVGRRLTLVAELKKTDGSPHSGKFLQISVDNPALNFNGTGTTGSDGKLTFVISRLGAAFDKSSYAQAVVRVWFGLVSDSVAITL